MSTTQIPLLPPDLAAESEGAASRNSAILVCTPLAASKFAGSTKIRPFISSNAIPLAGSFA